MESEREKGTDGHIGDRLQISNDENMDERKLADLQVRDNVSELVIGSTNLGLSSILGIFSPEINFEELQKVDK